MESHAVLGGLACLTEHNVLGGPVLQPVAGLPSRGRVTLAFAQACARVCACCLARSSFVGRHLFCFRVGARAVEGHCPLRAQGPPRTHPTPGGSPRPDVAWRLSTCPGQGHRRSRGAVPGARPPASGASAPPPPAPHSGPHWLPRRHLDSAMQGAAAARPACLLGAGGFQHLGLRLKQQFWRREVEDPSSGSGLWSELLACGPHSPQVPPQGVLGGRWGEKLR